MRSDLEGNKSRDTELLSMLVGVQEKILDGNITLTDESITGHIFDPNGSDRTITLPASRRGRLFVISNSGTANSLVVKDASATTIVTVYHGETHFVFGLADGWVSTPDVFTPAGASASTGLVPKPPAVGGGVGSERYLCEDGTWRDPGFAGSNAYATISDGTNTANSSGSDNIKFRTANNRLTIVVTDNDATHGDNVLFTLVEANIDHDALANFVVNEHIDHSAVSINTAANSGLAGGGNITASRSLTLDINNLASVAPVLADSFAFYDASGAVTAKATLTTLNGILDHDALLNFVANEHIDHSTVSITAGAGLTGGGTIAATRTISLDITGQDSQSPALADEIIYYDVSGLDFDKCTFTMLNAVLDHDSLLNFVANEHIDHTTVSINTAANSGLAGGGTIAASRSLTLDINNLTADTPVAADSIAFYDASGLDTNKCTITTLNGIIVITSLSGYVANEHINHTSVTLTAGNGLTGGGDISASRSFAVGAGTGITVNADDVQINFAVNATWTGTHTFQNTVDVNKEFIFSGIISPAQLTADTNNWAPPNIQTSSVIRFSTDASRSITGIDATGISSGEIKVFHNIGSFDAVFVDESASSTAANRIAMAANVTISGDSSIVLQYDGTSSRWRQFGGAGSGGGGGAPTSAQYLTLATDGTLSQERVLTPGDGLTGTDGGAGGNYTLAVGAGNGITVAADSVACDFAVQSDQETGTSTVKVVNPGVQHYHPSACKAWLRFNSSATIAASYNITSVTDSGTGDWTVNIATDFSSASYAAAGIAPAGASGFSYPNDGFLLNCDAASAAGTYNVGYVAFQTDTGTRSDPTSPNEISLVFFGDQ